MRGAPRGSARLHYRFGLALAWWGWHAGAARAYAAALALEPDFHEAHFKIGESLARRGRWREAARAFRQAARLAPWDVEAQANVVLALGRAGLWGQAAVALHRLINMRPLEAELRFLPPKGPEPARPARSVLNGAPDMDPATLPRPGEVRRRPPAPLIARPLRAAVVGVHRLLGLAAAARARGA